MLVRRQSIKWLVYCWQENHLEDILLVSCVFTHRFSTKLINSTYRCCWSVLEKYIAREPVHKCLEKQYSLLPLLNWLLTVGNNQLSRRHGKHMNIHEVQPEKLDVLPTKWYPENDHTVEIPEQPTVARDLGDVGRD